MARPPHPQQTEALVWIRECVDQLGDEGYAIAKAKYPHIGQPTFWRWQQMVRAELMLAASRAPAPAPATAAAPAPAPAASGLNDPSAEPLSFFENELGAMRRDVEALRSHAVIVDQSGGVRLRNPQLMIAATRLRHQMLDLFLKRHDTAVGAERQTQYMELVNTAIEHVLSGAKDPAEKAVMNRLRNALRDAHAQWQSVAHIVDPRRQAATAEGRA